MDGAVETPEKRKHGLGARHAIAKFGKLLGPRVLIDLDLDPEKQEQAPGLMEIDSEPTQEQMDFAELGPMEIFSSEPAVEQTSLVTTSPISSEPEQEVEQEQDEDQEQEPGLMDLVSAEPAQEQMDLVSSEPAQEQEQKVETGAGEEEDSVDMCGAKDFERGLEPEPQGRYNISWPDGQFASRWGPGAR